MGSNPIPRIHNKQKMVNFQRAKSEATKEKIRLSLMGKRNPKNRSTTETNYIMEKHLGRKLKSNEIVHHIDGDYTNNKIENLQVMDDKEHRSMHALERGFGKDRTNAKLTEKQIKEIVKAGKYQAKVLAKRFNVSDMTIYYVWRIHGRLGKEEFRRLSTKCKHNQGFYLDKHNRKRCNKCKRYLRK